MKYLLPWLVVGGLFVTGCGSEGVSKTNGGPSPKPSPGGTQAGKLDLGPENAKIEFVGTHVGDKPDPRTGGFTKFTGKAEFDPAAKTLQAVSVDIDTSSIWTEFDKLTNHLNTPISSIRASIPRPSSSAPRSPQAPATSRPRLPAL